MSKARVIIADFQHGSLEEEERILKDLATVAAIPPIPFWKSSAARKPAVTESFRVPT